MQGDGTGEREETYVDKRTQLTQTAHANLLPSLSPPLSYACRWVKTKHLDWSRHADTFL